MKFAANTANAVNTAIAAIAAVDIGTTAAKAAIIGQDGTMLARGQAGYPTQTGPGGEVEQHPEDWWNAACNALRQCEAGRFRIEALALSGQMQDLVAIGNSTEPPPAQPQALSGALIGVSSGALRPVILYADQRAGAEADAIMRRVGTDHWTHVTGNLQDSSSVLAKLLWLKRHEPSIYHSAQAILFGGHDYVSWRACGVPATDLTNASTTGLLNLGERGWATDLLDAVEVRTDWLPPIVPAEQIVGKVTNKAAAELGLPVGTPVMHGAGDAGAATIGAGAGEPGRRYLYLGTSGWLATSTDGRRADPQSGIFTLAHPDPRRTILIGPMLTAGGNLDWLRHYLLGNASHGEVSILAESAPPGCSGVLFLPYLAGERSPFRDSTARAGFLGIHSQTTQAEMARAVFEGVAFGFRSIADAMPDGGPGLPRELFATGGGMRSDLWCRILANVLQCTVRRLASPEDVGVRGAAILAGKGVGWYTSYDPGTSFFPVDAVFEPAPELVAVYDRVYEAFRKANPALGAHKHTGNKHSEN